MYSQRPAWLEQYLTDTEQPPKLFAWNTSNIASKSHDSLAGSKHQDDLDRRIYVMGVGNLGRLFASSLAQSSNPPPITLVVHRRELLTEWTNSKGIEILRDGVLDSQKNFDIEWWTDTQPDHGPIREVSDGKKIRNLIVTTKATAALPQVDRVRRYLDQNSTVAFAQNGMSKLWPPHGLTYTSHRFVQGNSPNFLACVVYHGVTSLGSFKSHHASHCDLAVGAVLPNPNTTKKANYLVDQIVEAPFLEATRFSRTEMWMLQLEKLVLNAIINPLTAILRCRNGAIFADASLEDVIDQLVGETTAVLQALINHSSTAEIFVGMPKVDMTRRRNRLPAEEEEYLAKKEGLLHRFSHSRITDFVHRTGYLVKDNTSSTLQDVRAGKSTEIRHFNGWIVETAAFLDQNLDVSGHQILIDLVESGKALEASQLKTYFRAPARPSRLPPSDPVCLQ